IAQSELDALTKGPDPFDLRAAQREVDRAKTALTAAQSLSVASSKTTTPDPGSVTQGQKDAAVSDAQFALQAAQDAMSKLQQPPKPEAVTAAKNKLSNA